MMASMRTTPPATPPPIAPALVDLCVTGTAVGEVSIVWVVVKILLLIVGVVSVVVGWEDVVVGEVWLVANCWAFR
jgi:hypothetical protein